MSSTSKPSPASRSTFSDDESPGQGRESSVGRARSRPSRTEQRNKREEDCPPGDSDCPGNLQGVIQRNINDIVAGRRRIEARQTTSERVAGAITRAAGNMWFAYIHALWFGVWILLNVFGPAFDPFPFVLLTTVVSLEAIFLTLMVLVSQNREAKLEEQRADLDLQIDLLAEHEVTRLLSLVRAIARKVGAEEAVDEEVQDLERDVRPRDLINELEESEPEKNESASHADGA
jgi:uncharacterized membrane protein